MSDVASKTLGELLADIRAAATAEKTASAENTAPIERVASPHSMDLRKLASELRKQASDPTVDELIAAAKVQP